MSKITLNFLFYLYKLRLFEKNSIESYSLGSFSSGLDTLCRRIKIYTITTSIKSIVNIIIPETPQQTVAQFRALLALLRWISSSSSSSGNWFLCNVQFQPSKRILRMVKGMVSVTKRTGDTRAATRSWVWLVLIW